MKKFFVTVAKVLGALLVVLFVLSEIARYQWSRDPKRNLWEVQLRNDLKNLSTAQESYLADNRVYAPSLAALSKNYSTTPGVSITVDSASATAWSATARHAQTTTQCTISFDVQAKQPERDGELLCRKR